MKLHLTLRELEIFCVIAQTGNVLKASHIVGLTQSAASQALARLENNLQQRLFDRVGKRLILNAHGRTLLPKAYALLDRANQLEGLFTKNVLSLSIGASTTIGNYLMPKQLATYRFKNPAAKLDLSIGNTQTIVDAVANFDVDIGFIEGPCHHAELHVFPWCFDELVVFIGASHPQAHCHLSLQELASLPWLLRELGSGTREEVERILKPYLGHLNLDMEIGDSEGIKHAVAAGLGVSCLSRYVITDLLEQKKIVEIHADLPIIKRELYCVMHKERDFSQELHEFMGCVPSTNHKE